MKLVGDGVEEQAEQVMCNLEAILVAAGCAWPDVVKTTILCAFLRMARQCLSLRLRYRALQVDKHRRFWCSEPDLRQALPR